MARLPRITIPAYPHHIIQRGNNRAATFFADDDYRFFLECLRQAKVKCQNEKGIRLLSELNINHR